MKHQKDSKHDLGMVRIKNGKQHVVLDDENQNGLNLLKILNEVEKEYSEIIGNSPRDFDNWRVFIKYRKIMVDIAKYVVESSQGYYNRFEDVAADYFRSIYKRHSHYKRVPFLTHLSVNSEKNLMHHDEFIDDYEQKYGEKYWQTKPIVEDRLKMIADAVEKHNNDSYHEDECFDVDIQDV